MDLMWALVVGVVSLAAGGGLVALALSARTRDLQQRLTQVSDELAKLRDEKSALAIRCASLQTELEKDQIMFAERQATLEAARASFGDAFKIISTDALAKFSRRSAGDNAAT